MSLCSRLYALYAWLRSLSFWPAGAFFGRAFARAGVHGNSLVSSPVARQGSICGRKGNAHVC